jgi:hypothetical protein
VGGVPAADGRAAGTETAPWNADVPLTPGTNAITISASDNSTTHNEGSQTLFITYDNVPPKVTGRSPSGNSSGVPLASAVTIQFNEAMAPGSLTDATFFNGQGLSGAISYDTASHSATFTPDSPFDADTTFTFALTTGVRDAAGNALATPETWSFSTQPPSSSSGGGGGCFIQATSQH